MLFVSISVSYDLDLSLGDSDLDSDLPVGDSDTPVGDSDLDSDLPVGDSTTTLVYQNVEVRRTSFGKDVSTRLILKSAHLFDHSPSRIAPGKRGATSSETYRSVQKRRTADKSLLLRNCHE